LSCVRTQKSSLSEGNEHLERVRWRDIRTGNGRDAQCPACVCDDGGGSQHALARRLRHGRCGRVHQDRARAPPTIWLRLAGHSRAHRFSWRQAFRAFSRSAMCVAAASSASRPRSAKARSRFSFVHQVLPRIGHGSTGSRLSMCVLIRAAARCAPHACAPAYRCAPAVRRKLHART